MSDEKRYRISRGVEKMFGIPERPQITMCCCQLTEEELQELSGKPEENTNEISEEDRIKKVEETKEILENIKGELEKKED